jgi:hypothetical protein
MAYQLTQSDIDAPVSKGYQLTEADVMPVSQIEQQIGGVGPGMLPEMAKGVLRGLEDPVAHLFGFPAQPVQTPQAAATAPAQIGRAIGGQVIPAIAATELGGGLAEAARIPALLGRMGAGAGLGAIQTPQHPLTGAALGGVSEGLGEAAGGLLRSLPSVLRPFKSRAESLRGVVEKYPDILPQPQEIAQTRAQVGTPVSLGALIGDQDLAKLGTTKDSALELKNERQGTANNILDILRGNSTHPQLANDISNEVKQNFDLNNQAVQNNYSLASQIADSDPNASMLNYTRGYAGIGRELIPGQFAKGAKNLIEGDQAGIDPGLIKDVKGYLDDPTKYNTFSKAQAAKVKFNKVGANFASQGNGASAAAAFKMARNMKADIGNNMPASAQNAYQQAESDYANTIAPFKEVAPIKSLVNKYKATGNLNRIPNAIAADSPEAEKLRSLLPQSTLNKILAHQLTPAVDAAGNAKPAILGRKLGEMVDKRGGMGVSPDIASESTKLNALNKVSPEYIKSLSVPQTGAMNQKAINDIRNIATVGALTHMPDSPFGKLANLVAAAHGLPQKILNLPGMGEFAARRWASDPVFEAFMRGPGRAARGLTQAAQVGGRITPAAMLSAALAQRGNQ